MSGHVPRNASRNCYNFSPAYASELPERVRIFRVATTEGLFFNLDVRKPVPKILLALLVCGGAWFRVDATTFVAAYEKCPVCEQEFVVHVLASYSHFGEHPRDLTGGPQVGSRGIQTCPHCLYTSLQSDFDKLIPAEVTRMRESIGKLPMRFQPDLRERIIADPLRHRSEASIVMLDFFNALREKDLRRKARSQLIRYRRIGRADPVAFARVCRETVEVLREAYSERAYLGRSVEHAYLIGEIARRGGAFDEALKWFHTAKSKRFKPKGLNTWIAEQSELARNKDSSAQDRKANDPYFLRKEKQTEYAKKHLNAMFAGMQTGEAPESWAVRPLGKWSSPVIATIQIVQDLCENGDKEATRFLATWLSTLPNSKANDWKSTINDCFEVLGRYFVDHSSDPNLPGQSFENRRLKIVFDYAVRGELSESLEKNLRDLPWSTSDTFVIHVALGRGDRGLLPVLREFAGRNSNWRFAKPAKAYFSRFGELVDIEPLMTYAKKLHSKKRSRNSWHGSLREDVESAVWAIRLRQAIANP